jgi:hypothetical protein
MISLEDVVWQYYTMTLGKMQGLSEISCSDLVTVLTIRGVYAIMNENSDTREVPMPASLPRILTDNATLRIPAGVHYITAPILVRGKHIRIIGEDNAVLRGSIRLGRQDFFEAEEGVLAAKVNRPVDGLYVGGRKYRMARYPKFTDPDEVFGGYAADCIAPEKVREWQNPVGGYIHAMHAHLWGGYSYRIEGKNPDGTLALSGGWQNNRQMGMHAEYRFAENIREEMTEPGEWCYCESDGCIYLRPVAGDDLDEAEAVVASSFFVLEDCEDVTIENLTLEQGARTFMETKEPLLRSDWTVCRKGAVLVKNSRNCTVDRCTLRDIGSNGVFVDGNCARMEIKRSHFREIGASAVCFVGHPSSVRSPLFEYGETQEAATMDLTPGPRSEDYPKECLVEDCLIEYVGMTEKQATGVEISMAFGVTVRNCTICHTSRAGINISEGTFGGHVIEGCDVFDTVRETGDHGSFNSWGRDRFWHLRDVSDEDCGRYAHLDMLAPNTITRSRFRCDRGWDIDLDDGSSNYLITQNLCLHGGIKLREGFRRVVRGNVTVDTIHLHAWYPHSEDVVENNIVGRPYSPILMPPAWEKSINRNILHTDGQTTPTRAEALSTLSGQDGESVCLDCGFRNPAASDYTPTNSAVTGFEDFPTEFGVRYAPLRALADEPSLPIVKRTDGEGLLALRTLGGVILRNIADDGEMSVYGTAGHDGALVLEAAGEAAARGLMVGDVIVACNGTPVASAEALPQDVDWKGCTLTVLRKQIRTEL